MRHAWIALALWGCSSDAIPQPDVALLLGQESNAWTDAQPARIQVQLVPLANGTPTMPTVLADDAVGTTPPDIVPILEEHFAGTMVATFEATALDANKAPVLRGHSIYYGMTSIYAVRIPIFMGKVQSWARPLSELSNAHQRPIVTTMYELLIAAGGEPVAGQDLATPEFFDAAAWQTSSAQPPLPRTPKSVASLGTQLILIDDTGSGWLDLNNDATGTVPATDPPLDYAQISGGATFEQPSTRFIVGATRQEGAPTDKVLVLALDDNGNLTSKVLTLTTPRLGAAAGFVGTTLVVSGGSATGAGVEVLAMGATAFTTLPFPPDATAGHGMAPLDANTALVAGGQDAGTMMPASMRSIDLTCTANCAATEIGTLPMPLARTKVFVLDPSQMVVVGETDENSSTGVDHAFSFDPTKPAPFAPKELAFPAGRARSKATAALLPNGQLGLVGGFLLDSAQSPAKSIEVFIE
jgi:hypothetical protein